MVAGRERKVLGGEQNSSVYYALSIPTELSSRGPLIAQGVKKNFKNIQFNMSQYRQNYKNGLDHHIYENYDEY
jgi:hypothetical protein